MSEVSDQIEGITSVRSSLVLSKITKTREEDIISKINNLRFQLKKSLIKTIEIIKLNTNKEDKTIRIKDINKTIHYHNDDILEKLIYHLEEVISTKQLLPELSLSTKANYSFSRNFSSFIDANRGLMNKSNEIDERVARTYPSKIYQGLYLPNIELKDFESFLSMIIIEEFIILTNKTPFYKSENIAIEFFGDETPQIISILNPYYNSGIVSISKKRGTYNCNVYILYLTNIIETAPETLINASPKYDFTEFSGTNNLRLPDIYELSSLRSPMPKKYEKCKVMKPDINIDICRKFIHKMDIDGSDKLTPYQMFGIIRKYSLAFEDSVNIISIFLF